jgi:hypothetical protein
MKSTNTRSYRVVDLDEGEVWDFDTAEQVALHMWGRYIPGYAVFKRGVRWKRRIGGELRAYQRALERFDPESARLK